MLQQQQQSAGAAATYLLPVPLACFSFAMIVLCCATNCRLPNHFPCVPFPCPGHHQPHRFDHFPTAAHCKPPMALINIKYAYTSPASTTCSAGTALRPKNCMIFCHQAPSLSLPAVDRPLPTHSLLYHCWYYPRHNQLQQVPLHKP